MRMWKVDPTLLCNKHLVGEHFEMHMFYGCLEKGKSLRGYVSRGLVELDYIPERHDILADEMLRRGMKHRSEMLGVIAIGDYGFVDTEENLTELSKRCSKCREKIRETYGNTYIPKQKKER